MQLGGPQGGPLQAIQARLETLIGKPTGLIETLPKPIQKRIQYLRSLQEEYNAKTEEYQSEMDELEKKYNAIYAPLLAKRAAIVKGETEAPADIKLETTQGDEVGPPGIPEFWLSVLRVNEVTAANISEKDEEVLGYLVDIKAEDFGDEAEETGFKLSFEFAENPFFSNKVLTKTYHMAETETNLEKVVGTKIDWKAGKNITVKTMKKKQKPGRGGKSNAKPITKTVTVDSFFSFFSPPEIPQTDDIEEEELEQLQAALEDDYEIGEVIRDDLIPNAIAWYTGDIKESEEEDSENESGQEGHDEDDDEDNDDDDDEDDEEDDDEEGSSGEEKEKKGKSNAAQTAAPVNSSEQPTECKQQ